MSVCRLVGRSIGRLVGRSVCHNFLLWYGSLTCMLQSEHLFSSIHSVSKRCLANDIGFISMSNRQNSTFFFTFCPSELLFFCFSSSCFVSVSDRQSASWAGQIIASCITTRLSLDVIQVFFCLDRIVTIIFFESLVSN